MIIKYSIINCLAREGVYRAIVHIDGIKHSKDYSKHEYNTLGRSAIEHDLKNEVTKLLTSRIEIVKAKNSLWTRTTRLQKVAVRIALFLIVAKRTKPRFSDSWKV